MPALLKEYNSQVLLSQSSHLSSDIVLSSTCVMSSSLVRLNSSLFIIVVFKG